MLLSHSCCSRVLQRCIHKKGMLSKCKVNSRTSAAKSRNEITFYLKKSNGFYSRCFDIENCSSLWQIVLLIQMDSSSVIQKDNVLYTNHLTQAFNLFSLLTVVWEIVWEVIFLKQCLKSFIHLMTSVKNPKLLIPTACLPAI